MLNPVLKDWAKLTRRSATKRGSAALPCGKPMAYRQAPLFLEATPRPELLRCSTSEA